METLLNIIKQRNPEMAEYLDLMQQIQIKEQENEEHKSDPATPSLLKEVRKLEQINKKLFAIIGALKEQLYSEINWNDDFAKAIGACPECFGNDPDCKVCRGFGKSGYFVPDLVLYNKYILPANNSLSKRNPKS